MAERATDDDAPALAERSGAVASGCGCGVIGTGVFVGGAWFVVSGMAGASDAGTAAAVLVTGAVTFIVGACILSSASDDDAKHHRRQMAPQLPLDLAPEGAPVWIEGVVVCPRPVVVPRLGAVAAWLRLYVSRRRGKSTEILRCADYVRRTWIDTAGGRVELDFASVNFDQVPRLAANDAQASIAAECLPVGERATAWGLLVRERRAPPAETREFGFDAIPGVTRAKTDVLFDAKHPADRRSAPASQLPAGVEPVDDEPPDHTSAAGGPAEDALVLRGQGDLPLLVTPLTRREWIAHVETGEVQTRTMGASFVALGAAVAVAGGAARAGLDAETVAAACGAAFLLTLAALVRKSLKRARELRRRAEDAADALEKDLAGADASDAAAGVRVAARLVVYDQLAAEHNDALSHFPTSWAAKLAGHRKLPLRGDGA